MANLFGHATNITSSGFRLPLHQDALGGAEDRITLYVWKTGSQVSYQVLTDIQSYVDFSGLSSGTYYRILGERWSGGVKTDTFTFPVPLDPSTQAYPCVVRTLGASYTIPPNDVDFTIDWNVPVKDQFIRHWWTSVPEPVLIGNDVDLGGTFARLDSGFILETIYHFSAASSLELEVKFRVNKNGSGGMGVWGIDLYCGECQYLGLYDIGGAGAVTWLGTGGGSELNYSSTFFDVAHTWNIKAVPNGSYENGTPYLNVEYRVDGTLVKTDTNVIAPFPKRTWITGQPSGGATVDIGTIRFKGKGVWAISDGGIDEHFEQSDTCGMFMGGEYSDGDPSWWLDYCEYGGGPTARDSQDPPAKRQCQEGGGSVNDWWSLSDSIYPAAGHWYKQIRYLGRVKPNDYITLQICDSTGTLLDNSELAGNSTGWNLASASGWNSIPSLDLSGVATSPIRVKLSGHQTSATNATVATMLELTVEQYQVAYMTRTIGTGQVTTRGLQEKQVSVADTLSATDSLSEAQISQILLSLADAVAAGEDTTVQLGQVKMSLSTALSLADSVAEILGQVKVSESDAFTITEGLTPQIGSVQLSALDTLGAAESLTAPLVGGLQINFATGLSLADALTAVLGGVKFSASTALSLAEVLTPDVVTPWQLATTLTLTKGAISSGSLDLTYSDDAQELVLTEVTGAYTNPTTGGGFTYDFTFGGETSVPTTDLLLNMKAWYQGNPAHNVKLQQWNYTAGSWTNVTANATDFPDAASEQSYQFHLIHDANYLSGGQVQVRIIHTSNGTPTHLLHIDEMMLMRSIGVHDVEDALALEEFLTLRAGTVLVSESDSASLSDSLLTQFGDVQIIADSSLSLAEILSAKVGSVIITADESLSAFSAITVLASGGLQININLSDNLLLSEVLETLPSGLKFSVLETLLADEWFSTGGAMTLTLEESLSVVDALTTPEVGQIILALSNSLSLSDAINLAIGDIKASVAEGLTLSEAIDAALSGIDISAQDDVAVTEALTAWAGILYGASVSDDLALTDSAILQAMQFAHGAKMRGGEVKANAHRMTKVLAAAIRNTVYKKNKHRGH